MTDLILGAALIAFAVGILIGAVATYSAWQNDVRQGNQHLRRMEQRMEQLEKAASINGPDRIVRGVRGPWGGAS